MRTAIWNWRPSVTAATTLVAFLAVASSGFAQAKPEPLSKRFINPQDGFTQVVEVKKGGLRWLYISGQTGHGETFKAAATMAFERVAQQLKAAGAATKDVVKLNTYVVDWKPEMATDFFAAQAAVFGEQPWPANTLVGVTTLFVPVLKIEIEAVAVLDAE